MSRASSASPTADVRILRPSPQGTEGVLTPDAIAFIADLARTFRPRVLDLLPRRRDRQRRFDAGERPRFLAETAHVRESAWRVASAPPDLQDRRVEITGPVDRKMIINALNCGASVFMADFEDANSPTWENCVVGQKNLREAVSRPSRPVDRASGQPYELAPRPATLMVRPRGWHLLEKHVAVDGAPIPAGLFDFGLFFFHNARELLARGTEPYFYLLKMESHLEARLWNDAFIRAQDALAIPRGTIRATVLIETFPAAFEMDEILFELREHSAGLNCGRWDYIFSYIKKLRADAARVTPDRAQITMEQPFLRAYTQLLVKTCHRRGAHAMGGMAAQVPIKDDPGANAAALEKVRADKRREAGDGHDGTWVAHPGLVPVAKEIFDAAMPGPNQLERLREDVNVSEADLLRAPTGTRTEAGLRQNVNVGIQYLEAWLRGVGCVPLFNLMEDAATAEISRTQVWQWIRHGAALEDGRKVTTELVRVVIAEEMARVAQAVGPERIASGRFEEARNLFDRLATNEDFEEFLTIPAYESLISGTA